MQSNAGKYKDSTPDIQPAGKVFDQGGTASECIHGRGPEPPVPAAVEKFCNTDAGRPIVAFPRIHHGRANDEDHASKFYHGVSTAGSTKAVDLVNPPFKSLFKTKLEEKKESLYLSKKEKPLGKSRDNSAYMPSSIDRVDTAFGKPTIRSGTAGEVVNPDKSHIEVDKESSIGHDMYVLSHNDYNVEEMYDRKYDWSCFKKDSVYGVPTPHDNSGKGTGKTLKWIHDLNVERGAKIVSKRVDDFREKSQPQLGIVHDPIVDTLNVEPDHTFGMMLRPDEYGAGDLIHGRSPDAYLRGRDRERGVLHAIRQHLKKANYHNFDSLSQAFAHYDKNKDGFIDGQELRDVCFQLNVPIEDEMLTLLMSYCCSSSSQENNDEKSTLIDYLKFANFLNWKDKLPITVDDKDGSKPPETPNLMKQIDRAVTHHMTSSSMIGALSGVSTHDYRVYGTPTVRTDLAAPRNRRVSDTVNYGDESEALALVNPSIYSQKGVYETDFFAARPQDEIKRIFNNIGLEMTPELFNEAWKVAKTRDPRGRGEVSVETFRSVLDDVHATAIQAI
uniref:EF-hand domain-containing family member B-like n=1 Tax=Phallusia mammillata TaxID=59560 RepID=A0A6F9DCB2_9ASCI|nr:EF-hand domain-containing family member B-like [Phallusia mammillata]